MNVVKLKLQDGATLPKFQTTGASGMDVEAFIEEPIKIFPGQSMIIPTGIAVELPLHMAMLVLPRSGKVLSGLQVGNSPGLVDSDYRNEVGIIAYNASNSCLIIEPKERIAQFVFIETIRPLIKIVPTLSTSERLGGFGSTEAIRKVILLKAKQKMEIKKGVFLYYAVGENGIIEVSGNPTQNVTIPNCVATSIITGKGDIYLNVNTGELWEVEYSTRTIGNMHIT